MLESIKKRRIERISSEILNTFKSVKFLSEEKISLENQILSCQAVIEKGVPDLEGIKKRQKNIAERYIEISEKFNIEKGELIKTLEFYPIFKGIINSDFSSLENYISKDVLNSIKELSVFLSK